MSQIVEENMKSKLLVVDDSSIDRNTLSAVLRKKGFEVTIAESGARCFELVKADKPDAILLDIMMPDVLGNDVVKTLRKQFNAIELPILIVSSKADSSDLVESLSLGANDYITKPVDFEIATMRIRTHLKIAELSRSAIRLKELETVHAMVVTYNHEINNPLAIALGTLDSMAPQGNEKPIERMKTALWRIADIVKKIEQAIELRTVELEKYGSSTNKMFKLK